MKKINFTMTAVFAVLLSCIILTGCDFNPNSGANPRGKLIILQAYGNAGNNPPEGISHSFVELYNISNEAINLNGIGLYYANGTESLEVTADDPWERIALSGTIPAKSSFLILGAKHELSSSARYQIPDNSGDINNADLSLNRRAFKVALIKSTAALTVQNPFDTDGSGTVVSGYIDMVGSANEYEVRDLIFGFETAPARNSASVAVRRVDDTDTDDNSADFESLDYRQYRPADDDRMTNQMLELRRPRNSSVGSWDPFAEPTPSVTIYGAGVSSGNLELMKEAVLTLSSYITPMEARTDVTYSWAISDESVQGVITGGSSDESTFEITAAEMGTATVTLTVSGSGITESVSDSIQVIVSDGTSMLMILQANTYGNDNGGGGGFARSMVELYNNTNEAIDLTAGNYYLHIGDAEWTDVIKLEGIVPAKASFLIVDNTPTAADNTNSTPRAILPTADQEAPFVLGNTTFKIALMRNQPQTLSVANPFSDTDLQADYIDMLGAGNNTTTGFETARAGQSRPQAPRRTLLADTDNNSADFTQVDYRGTNVGNGMQDSELYKFWPRNSTMGAWNPITGLPQADPAVQ